MKTMRASIFLTLFFLSSCQTPAAVIPTVTQPPVPTVKAAKVIPTVTPVCVSSEPTQADIDSALSYTDDLFSEPDWQSSYSVSESRVAVTWNSELLGGAAYLEALIFPCGYEEPDLNNYFNDEYWQVIFENYESYEAVSECKTDTGVVLYQFNAVSQGFDYDVNYWTENDTDTRVMAVMIVFPVESSSLMDEYSTDLFRELTSCK